MTQAVSLIRVKDARDALRKKFAGRMSIDKVFDQQDASKTGHLTPEDLCMLAKKVGLGVTLNEAQVLIQSAKEEKGSDVKINKEELSQLLLGSN